MEQLDIHMKKKRKGGRKRGMEERLNLDRLYTLYLPKTLIIDLNIKCKPIKLPEENLYG
jgi:hypothetical protein